MSSTNFTTDTIVASLTVGQLMEIIASMINPAEVAANEQPTVNFVYGLKGIQHLFNCSHTQAQRYKDGILKPAVIQSGRKIMVDRDLAVKLFNEKGGAEDGE